MGSRLSIIIFYLQLLGDLVFIINICHNSIDIYRVTSIRLAYQYNIQAMRGLNLEIVVGLIPIYLLQCCFALVKKLIEPCQRFEILGIIECLDQHCKALLFVSIEHSLTAPSALVVCSANQGHRPELTQESTQLVWYLT